MQGPFKRTRIAPTPSGFLHLGNIFSFALTTAIARKTGASIFLRIDDLDQSRAQNEFIQDIFDTLNFLELPWDEGPRNLKDFQDHFSQIHRLPQYEQILQTLRSNGMLFACQCSRSQLQQSAPNGIYTGACLHKGYSLDSPDMNWRLITNEKKEFGIRNLATNTIIESLPENMNYFAVRKKDGMPSYQLASVADDIHFEVDLVVRGMDLYPSTLAQTYLANQLPPNSFQDIVFYHHMLLNDENGMKLSKTAGSISIQYLRKNGKKKEDIYTLLAQLTALDTDGIEDWQSFANAFTEKTGI